VGGGPALQFAERKVGDAVKGGGARRRGEDDDFGARDPGEFARDADEGGLGAAERAAAERAR
jgi:hypothetical protein